MSLWDRNIKEEEPLLLEKDQEVDVLIIGAGLTGLYENLLLFVLWRQEKLVMVLPLILLPK